MPVGATRLPNVFVRDVHPAVALRVQQHRLDQPAVVLLGKAALVTRRAAVADVPHQAVAQLFQFAQGQQPSSRTHGRLAGKQVEADRLLLQPPHLVEQRAARDTLVRTRAGTGPREALSGRASRQLEPSGSSPRRSACRPSRRGAPSPCSAPLTSPSRCRLPPARRPRCSRSSSPPARSPSPSPCP